jgi:hypothetical protein
MPDIPPLFKRIPARQAETHCALVSLYGAELQAAGCDSSESLISGDIHMTVSIY